MRLPLTRERRTEQSRGEELQQLLNELDQSPGSTERARTTADEESISSGLKASLARRAKELGMTPEQFLNDYSRRLQESNYPTPECLEPEEVQAVIDSGAPSQEQAMHIKTCQPCEQLLLRAGALSSPRMEKILATIHSAAAAGEAAHTVETASADAQAATGTGISRFKAKIASVGELLRR